MIEFCLRSAWRMDSDDPSVAETRWLARLKKYVKYEESLAGWLAAERLHDRSLQAVRNASQAGC